MQESISKQSTSKESKGKHYTGGLRLGEMERTDLIAQGTFRFLDEKFREDLDGIDVRVCNGCGHRAIKRDNKYQCLKCGDHADIHVVSNSFTSNTFMNIANDMGIDMKFTLNESKSRAL